ncbi:MAG: hypothetical protein ACFCUG_10260 [Thiotrichales bacterium]
MLIAVVAPAFGDLPLTIEDLLTAENRYRVELSGVFANTDRRNVSASYQVLQTGPDQFVQIPALVGEARRNSDIFVTTLGFRYGVNSRTEFFSRVSGIADTTRTQQPGASTSTSGNRWGDLAVGLNHGFLDDKETPAQLGFAEITLAENTAFEGEDFAHAKTWQVGATTYRAIDPLVLSLTAAYRHSAKRDVEAL